MDQLSPMTLALAADYGLVEFQAYPWSSTWFLIPPDSQYFPVPPTVQLFCLMTLLPLASCCWRLTIYDLLLLLRPTMPPKRLWIGLISRWQWRQAIDPPILASAPILSAKVKGILRGRPIFRIWKVSPTASNLLKNSDFDFDDAKHIGKTLNGGYTTAGW